jgi:hypothetical protein
MSSINNTLKEVQLLEQKEEEKGYPLSWLLSSSLCSSQGLH